MEVKLLSYTHSDPLYEALKGNTEITRGNPSENLRDLLSGKCDAAMISLVSYLENSEKLQLLHTANIHTMSTTGSTILISRGDLMKRKMDIAVTSATRTTSFYLSMILRQMKIDFSFVHSNKSDADSLLGESQYALVIGDEALRTYNTNYRILLDIGFEYSRLYEKSPVYAVMAAGKGDFSELTGKINHEMRSYRNYIENCSEKASQRLNINRKIMVWYFGLIRYEYEKYVQDGIDFVEKMMSASGK